MRIQAVHRYRVADILTVRPTPGVAPMLAVVHYVNQFFGGLGGEERANEPIHVRVGAVGSGRGLELQWADEARSIRAIIITDGFVSGRSVEAEPAIRAALEEYRPHVMVARPAFNAGRYGLACRISCRIAAEMGIPSVTAMSPEN